MSHSAPQLFIYHISQEDNTGYDTYSDAVVVAKSEEQAKNIHPDGVNRLSDANYKLDRWHDWCNKIENIKCVLLGPLTGNDFEEYDVICASFHAG